MRKLDYSKSAEAYDSTDHALDDQITKPLSRAEAQALREKHPSLPLGLILASQACAGLLTAVVAGLVTGQANVAWSVLYGATAVVMPGAVFARGLMSKVSLINPAAAVSGFFLWEMMKIGLVLAMLFAAPKLVTDLSWPAMLVGLVVTMKVVWLVLLLEAKLRRKSNKLTVG